LLRLLQFEQTFLSNPYPHVADIPNGMGKIVLYP